MRCALLFFKAAIVSAGVYFYTTGVLAMEATSADAKSPLQVEAASSRLAAIEHHGGFKGNHLGVVRSIGAGALFSFLDPHPLSFLYRDLDFIVVPNSSFCPNAGANFFEQLNYSIRAQPITCVILSIVRLSTH